MGSQLIHLLKVHHLCGLKINHSENLIQLLSMTGHLLRENHLILLVSNLITVYLFGRISRARLQRAV